MTSRRTAWGAGVIALAIALSSATPGPSARAQDADALIQRAYDAAYNLDHEEAAAGAARAVTLSPDLSRTHRAVATITWLRVLFLRGSVTVDYYMGSVSRSPKVLPKPPADLDAEFRAAIGRATSLAEAALARNPNDVSARFDAGAAYALQASYTASVEGRLSAAFRVAKRAFDAQENVLARDPARADAGLVVGTYRYLVSALGLTTRIVAYVVGFGGGKERGIGLLEAAARYPPSQVEANSALALIYSREGRHLDALGVLRRLEALYPRNRLFTLEAGASAIRAGRAAEAEATLSRGLARFDEDRRPKIPGERAIWLSKRGAARLAMNHQPEAKADLEAALALESAAWIQGRIRIDLGKLHDLAGRRADALREYRQALELCRRDDDGLGANEANRWMRRPFAFE